ncbi:hypothetical protein BCR34DRAFT_319785 [Clohesyomyces aquaticus]|uniref:Uncharacterized protein n=1 Tax=Clohesyomyces aquaticus TaxID=1231657 RepID=A0A1Y2A879_9PLEO|nr:hypothetical protein BCR34DRAFT_319785 [Clohesyomyces aquaticus]
MRLLETIGVEVRRRGRTDETRGASAINGAANGAARRASLNAEPPPRSSACGFSVAGRARTCVDLVATRVLLSASLACSDRQRPPWRRLVTEGLSVSAHGPNASKACRRPWSLWISSADSCDTLYCIMVVSRVRRHARTEGSVERHKPTPLNESTPSGVRESRTVRW